MRALRERATGRLLAWWETREDPVAPEEGQEVVGLPEDLPNRDALYERARGYVGAEPGAIYFLSGEIHADKRGEPPLTPLVSDLERLAKGKPANAPVLASDVLALVEAERRRGGEVGLPAIPDGR